MPQPALPFFAELGPALRLFRERAKLSASAVAQRAGIGKSQLSKYETGRELPKIDTLAKVLDVLAIEPLWLFYVMHLLSRGQLSDSLRVELLLLRGGAGFSVSGSEAQAFQRLLASVLDLHAEIVEERIRGRLDGKGRLRAGGAREEPE
ncbi:MAG TPA: helix-turn-helix transcriptional regulator [Thermoanaerobaculia bacterium]|nr:helix-turn-helix transcriptional regulator [Thermoanaerobaculia bacterium]